MILRVQVGSGCMAPRSAGRTTATRWGCAWSPRSSSPGWPGSLTGPVAWARRLCSSSMNGTPPGTGPAAWRTARGRGDLDVIIYSARKWARLALAGNPTVLLVLFVPEQEVVFRDEAGAELASNAHRFVSRLAAGRFLGYLTAQKAAMTGQAGAHTNRPELVAAHGYDTKYAMHALRLGLQGIELLTTGRITLPVPQPHRAYLRSIRRGERPLAEVLSAVTGAEARLTQLRDSPAIPDQPDRRWVDDGLHRSYLNFWASPR